MGKNPIRSLRSDKRKEIVTLNDILTSEDVETTLKDVSKRSSEIKELICVWVNRDDTYSFRTTRMDASTAHYHLSSICQDLITGNFNQD